jgi:hypothetical protein
MKHEDRGEAYAASTFKNARQFAVAFATQPRRGAKHILGSGNSKDEYSITTNGLGTKSG